MAGSGRKRSIEGGRKGCEKKVRREKKRGKREKREKYLGVFEF